MSSITFPTLSQQGLLVLHSMLQSIAESDSIRSLFGKSDPTSLTVGYIHRTFDLLLDSNGQLDQNPTLSGIGCLLRNGTNEVIAAVYLDKNGDFRSLELAAVFTHLPQHAQEAAALSQEGEHEVAILHVPELQLTTALLLAPHRNKLVWPLTTSDTFPQRLYTIGEFQRLADERIQRRISLAINNPRQSRKKTIHQHKHKAAER